MDKIKKIVVAIYSLPIILVIVIGCWPLLLALWGISGLKDSDFVAPFAIFGSLFFSVLWVLFFLKYIVNL